MYQIVRIRRISVFVCRFTERFRDMFDFSILKKILLIGFFISAMFIMYAVSSICATLTIKDADFVQCNSNYLKIKQPNMST